MISKVDFTPGVGIKQRISVSQYDVGRTIIVNLFDGYAPYVPPTGATAVMHATKPSGLGFSVSGTLDGAVASFETTAEMTAESGTMDAEVQISANGVVIGTANFVFYVEKSPHPTGTVDGTAEDVVNRIGAALDAAMDDIEDAKDAVVAEIQALVIATASQVSYDNTDSGLAATNVQDAVDEIKEDLSTKTGLSEDAKQALLACFAKVAWVDEHGQNYYDALEEALYPPVDLVRISAIYTQSGTVYETDSLDSLRSDLVVTAHYSDGTSGIVTSYTLSGTLVVGESTVYANYKGLRAGFSVSVNAQVGSMYITIANKTLSSGYIDDNGNVISVNRNYYIDEFYYALPFVLTGGGTILGLTKRSAYYDEDKLFIGRDYEGSAIKLVNNSNAVYEKFGWVDTGTTSIDYLFLLKEAPSSLFVTTGAIDADGNIKTDSGQKATDFIVIDGQTKFVLAGTGTVRIAFYDSSKNFISRFYNGSASGSIGYGDIPSNVAYCRFDAPINAVAYYPIARGI